MNAAVSKSFYILLLAAVGVMNAQRCFKNTISLSKVNLPTEVSVLNFPEAKNPNAAGMVITNASSGAALNSYPGKGIWIGKNSFLSDHSEVSIAFSKPINSLELKISSINNDAIGEEELQGFAVFNEKGEDISANAKFYWHTGSDAHIDSSQKNATHFDPVTRTIKPASGACCESASGRMEIVCARAFSKVFFRHQEMRLHPNGIILQGEIVFCVMENTKKQPKTEKKKNDPVVKKETEKKKESAEYEVGKTVELRDVSFSQGKAELLPESFSELDKLVRLMKENARMQIEVRGHTDNIGNPADNLTLSQERANAVKKYLVAKGIDGKRIIERGFGGSKPLVEKGTDAEREKNRRVEIFIKKN